MTFNHVVEGSSPSTSSVMQTTYNHQMEEIMKVKIISWNVDNDYDTTDLPEEVTIPDIIGEKPEDIEDEILDIVGVPVYEYTIESKEKSET